jgi:uncharacterized membrane protein YeiH
MTGYDEAFVYLDLVGTYAFATSGALAAKERGFDLFGVAAIAYIVACGGGILRDVCIGAIPPAGLSNWRYLVTALAAAAVAVVTGPWLRRFAHPVLVFDALGLAFFAVSGAQKTLAYGHGAQVAVLLGMTTAVGGGVTRDVLLRRVPTIMQREIYASAALAGAVFEVVGGRVGWSGTWRPWVAIALCFGLRFVALRRSWNLPRFHADGSRPRRGVSP